MNFLNFFALKLGQPFQNDHFCYILYALTPCINMAKTSNQNQSKGLSILFNLSTTCFFRLCKRIAPNSLRHLVVKEYRNAFRLVLV